MRPPIPARRTVLATVGSFVLTGCIGPVLEGGSTDEPTATTANDSMNDDTTGRRTLQDPLPGLVDASDRETYAETHGLDLHEDGVVVVVELEAEGSLPEHLVETVESRYAGRVQAVVAVDRLYDIAAHDDVRAVRPPADAHPQ